MIPSDQRFFFKKLILIPLDFRRKFSDFPSTAGKATAIRRTAVRETSVSRQLCMPSPIQRPLKPLGPSQCYRIEEFQGVLD